MELGAEVNIRCRSPQVGAEVIPCRTSIAPIEANVIRIQSRSLSDPPLSDIGFKNKIVWSPDYGLP